MLAVLAAASLPISIVKSNHRSIFVPLKQFALQPNTVLGRKRRYRLTLRSCPLF